MASTLKDSAIIMAFLKMFWDTKGVLVGEEEGVKKLAETFKKIRKKYRFGCHSRRIVLMFNY